MNLLRIAARVAVGTGIDELFKKLEERETRLKRTNRGWPLKLEIQPFDKKNFSSRGWPKDYFKDMKIEARANNKDGLSLYVGLGKTEEEALEDLAKSLKKALWS